MIPTGTQPLVLVVEDEPTLRRDIVEELHEAGYRTLAADDGQAALAVLNGDRPDLVLCDITMPNLDGYGLLATLREDRPDMATTPIVFLTALSEPQEVIEGKLLGADDYLVKPVDYDLMLATIAARLRQVERIRGQHGTETARLQQALADLSDGGAKQALDLITLGIVLLDRRGEVIHANRAAYDMAIEADFLTIRHNALHAREPACDRDLQRALCGTLEAAKAGTGRVAGAMLHRAKDAQAIAALARTLAPGTPDEPHVALFLPAPTQDRRVSEPLLIDLFSLTPTEARVAAALAGGARASEVAADLNVSQTTIAFHMRNLFQKTGINRQTDLVALILAGPMAIEPL